MRNFQSLLTLRKEGISYLVNHFARSAGHSVAYVFDGSNLPESTVLHLGSLSVFRESQDSVYSLTEKQSRDIQDVMAKLNIRDESGYAFSSHLHTTYIIELIHLITKIHYGSLAVRSN